MSANDLSTLSTDELIQKALSVKAEDDEYRKPVAELERRGTREVFDAARRLCNSVSVDERVLGADILGELGFTPRSFPAESMDILVAMLEDETDASVLGSIGMAISYLGVFDSRAVGKLTELADHSDEDVRYTVARGLGTLIFEWNQDKCAPDEIICKAINTLIHLSSDEDADVRNWATFELRSDELTALDMPEIADALLRRLNDDVPEVRAEALLGLAERKDERVIEPLLKEITWQVTQDNYWDHTFEAASIMADSRLCPALLAFKKSCDDWTKVKWLTDAIEACHCNKSVD